MSDPAASVWDRLSEVSLAEYLRLHAEACRQMGSPFYAVLMHRMADDVEADGPVRALLGPHQHDPAAAHQLRLLGGVHRLVLAGREPALARHYPSVGGDGDAEAAWPRVREILAAPPPMVLDAMTRPPQTNEVGRSAALVGGFLVVAGDFGLPLRVLELGSSAGLNLRFDRYRYEEGDVALGDPESPVRFEGLWGGRPPPFGAPLDVAERRGCDRDPVDAATPDGRLTLLSYVWPDQTERFGSLSAALDVAARFSVTVDGAVIPVWLGERLSERRPGMATVVFHSIVWQYLTDDERVSVERTLTEAGASATGRAPLAWLRLEPSAELTPTELRLTTWPGGDERLLARCHYHLGPIEWL